MKRAKLEGLRRNAAVAMGNRGDATYNRPLQEALADPSPTIRRHAAWALGRNDDRDGAAAALRAALATEDDVVTRDEMERALAVAVSVPASGSTAATGPRRDLASDGGGSGDPTA
jgi:epoxyqueuosine reductase